MPKAILIAGPTASGKSAAALMLAGRLNGTVVNADSMQVYRELALLTARPTAADEAKAPHRLYGVLNNRLYDRRYIAGGDYSIADMISYPWTAGWKLQGIDLDEFKYFKRWHEEMAARPAVQRGMEASVGPVEDPATLSPEEQERRRKLLYNQRARPAPAA